MRCFDCKLKSADSQITTDCQIDELRIIKFTYDFIMQHSDPNFINSAKDYKKAYNVRKC